MKIQEVPVESISSYARNPRRHPPRQIELLAQSIKEFGFTVPVLVDKDGILIAGHGRLEAARKLGLGKVPAVRMDDLSPTQVKKLRLLDNKLAQLAEDDVENLKAELADLDDKELSILFGFDDLDLGLAPEGDPDACPDVPEGPAVTKKGDTYRLGGHLLVCGDSLSTETVSRLLGGKKASMTFTDPPYLMDFQGAISGEGKKSKHGAKIANDDLKLGSADGRAFMDGFCRQVKDWTDGAWYMTFYRLGIDHLFESFSASGLKWRNMVIWKKEHLNLSNSDYKALYEPMAVGWSDDWTPVFYGWEELHEFHGRKGEVDVWELPMPSVWEIARTKKNDLHPTMKPVALVERCVKNSSLPGETVLDLFAGSGTTLIACERTNRLARLVELEPKYCDVIVKRWEEFTGKKAERIPAKS